jgi:TM2 domain-containing membrane protein YozV
MSDDIGNTTDKATDPTGAGAAERVGFCQDCGTPLTRETARPVGTGVFCEPCLTARVGGTGPGFAAGGSGYATGGPEYAAGAGYTTVPPVTGVPPVAGVPPNGFPIDGTPPSPALAAILSIIPGVGTMYNGQYAKGIAYLLIISVLDSLGKADHLGIFSLLAFVAWVYQIIDAYQTAKARQEGRPLPNPFGLNEIGERMGFGKTWGNSPGAAAAAAGTVPPAGASAAYAQTGYATTPPPMGGAPVTSGPDWIGYVPPTNFASAPVVSPTATAQASAAWGQAPYAATYTGTDATYAAQLPVVPIVPPAPRRFPVGAIWLIGLGVLFLLVEFTEQWGWNINGNWVPTIIFAGLAAWTLQRKLKAKLPLVCVVRWPLELGTLALLFALQAMDIVSLGRTWPVLFIVFGVTLILERTALANLRYGAPAQFMGGPGVPEETAADAERTRAAWAANNAAHDPADSGENDLTKSGGL